MSVILSLPSGSKEPNPSEKRLSEILSITDAAFWNCGTGAAAVTVDDVPGEPSLLIVQKIPFGFHLQFLLTDDTSPLVSVCSTEYHDFTEITLGGEPWRIPTAFFIPGNEAKSAVLQFARTGKPPGNVTWVRLNEQEW